MTRKLVTSSNIATIGYDPEQRLLEIEFKSARSKPTAVWAYLDVPPETHAELLAAESIGSYFSRVVRTHFVGRKVEEVSG